MKICSVRGAITIEENTRECIIKNSEILLKEVLKQNDIQNENIINMIFSATKDVTKAYPAIATRNLGITDCPIMCTQELNIENSLPMCIRVMITFYTDKSKKDINHIYLKEAKKLRPDIALKENGFSVAIDGPAGSGKSTVSKLIAKELNFTYIDTGAMFRAVAYYFEKNCIDYKNIENIGSNLGEIDICLKFENEVQQVYLNNENITKYIRTQNISKIASEIGKIKEVRENLLNIQRNMAKNKNVIMDGRDIGTNVLPNANVKIYLDADIEERAKRRCLELSLNGNDYDFEKVALEIKERDEADKNREIAPLKIAEDAIIINSTNLTIHQVSEKIINIIKENIR